MNSPVCVIDCTPPSGRKATSSNRLVEIRSDAARSKDIRSDEMRFGPAVLDPGFIAILLFASFLPASIRLLTIFASGSPCSVESRFFSVNFAVNLPAVTTVF